MRDARDCGALAATLAQLLTTATPPPEAVMQALVRACSSVCLLCERALRRHSSPQGQSCADACRAGREACQALLAAERPHQ